MQDDDKSQRPERCDRCRFWVIAEQHFGHLKGGHPDDEEGTCHRRAPHPTMGWFEAEVLSHLTTLSWHIATDEEAQRDFGSWEEAHTEFCSWPTTEADDWCGEFEARAEPI